MAKPHSKSGKNINKAAKTERTPWDTSRKTARLTHLNLKGRWLEELGFFSGQVITVTVEQGKLVIQREFNL